MIQVIIVDSGENNCRRGPKRTTQKNPLGRIFQSDTHRMDKSQVYHTCRSRVDYIMINGFDEIQFKECITTYMYMYILPPIGSRAVRRLCS